MIRSSYKAVRTFFDTFGLVTAYLVIIAALLVDVSSIALALLGGSFFLTDGLYHSDTIVAQLILIALVIWIHVSAARAVYHDLRFRYIKHLAGQPGAQIEIDGQPIHSRADFERVMGRPDSQ